MLTKEAKELKREYHRMWRKNNKDKVKKNNENYWKRKAEKIGLKQVQEG